VLYSRYVTLETSRPPQHPYILDSKKPILCWMHKCFDLLRLNCFFLTPKENSINGDPKGACTHTSKIGAGSESDTRCNVNKWVFAHAAGPAELPVRQISVPDLNSTSRAPGRRPAYQFQCNWIGTCTRVWTCRCRTTVLNTSVCMKPTSFLCRVQNQTDHRQR
jgi:hypothetical protein